MKYKMIVFDLDYTLLKNDKTISGYSRCVIEKYQSLGGKIVIATGRNFINSTKYQKLINANGLIALNGALIYFENNLIDSQFMDQRKVKGLVNRLITIDGAFIAIAYPTKIITNNKNLIVDSSKEYSDFSDYSLDEIQKITIFTKNHKLVKAIDYDSLGYKLLINSKEPDYFVIMPKDIDKLNGIKRITELLNISLVEVVCFGDDSNDISMLMQCGKGIAVRNADEFIKSIADETCEDNQNDGPARWIEKEIFVKNK